MVRRRRRAGQRGFTLIELLVSMALSTVGLLGLLALQMIAIRGNMMSRNFGEAIGIAQAQLEAAAHTAYASLSTLADPACIVSGTPPVVTGGAQNVSPTQDQSTTTNSQAIYDRCTVVTVNANNTTTIAVTVYWSDTYTNLHSVVLQTRRSP
ncbi:MAG: type IV pilus modification PilV family protein [Polyangia bacterium]